MEGNATLFMRKDQVEAAWKIIMPILEARKTDLLLIFRTMPRDPGVLRMPKRTDCATASVDCDVD
jgi:glucose-6-phosphate 1-dehydrogenase